MSAFTRNNAEELRLTLVDAVVRCSERCLYQAAKWYDRGLAQYFSDLISLG